MRKISFLCRKINHDYIVPARNLVDIANNRTCLSVSTGYREYSGRVSKLTTYYRFTAVVKCMWNYTYTSSHVFTVWCLMNTETSLLYLPIRYSGRHSDYTTNWAVRGLNPKRPDRLRGPPCLLNEYWGVLFRGANLATHLHLVHTLRISGAVPLRLYSLYIMGIQTFLTNVHTHYCVLVRGPHV
jgi:hypothetical protein